MNQIVDIWFKVFDFLEEEDLAKFKILCKQSYAYVESYFRPCEFLSAFFGNKKILSIKWYLEKGLTQKQKEKGLALAVHLNSLPLCKFFLKQGAKEINGPIYNAIAFGSIDLVKLLKPYAKKEDFQCIDLTDAENYIEMYQEIEEYANLVNIINCLVNSCLFDRADYFMDKLTNKPTIEEEEFEEMCFLNISNCNKADEFMKAYGVMTTYANLLALNGKSQDQITLFRLNVFNLSAQFWCVNIKDHMQYDEPNVKIFFRDLVKYSNAIAIALTIVKEKKRKPIIENLLKVGIKQKFIDEQMELFKIIKEEGEMGEDEMSEDEMSE